MPDREREEALTLELLEAIEERSDVTQRHLAKEMGVALGLANSYLKRCVRKGLVKIQNAPANRYFYYLTPHGFAEKSRLTARYMHSSFAFYRKASNSCNQVLEQCRAIGFNRIGLFGYSELAEIAAVQALEKNFEVLCLCDSRQRRRQFLRIPVVSCLPDAPAVEAWLYTALDGGRTDYEELLEQVDPKRVFIPSILGIRDPLRS